MAPKDSLESLPCSPGSGRDRSRRIATRVLKPSTRYYPGSTDAISPPLTLALARATDPFVFYFSTGDIRESEFALSLLGHETVRDPSVHIHDGKFLFKNM